ncbi:hypothetical protein FQ185_00115 [Pseudomonas sp. ANT_H12B]|nr:hypothetical protein FQ185_00115 [Pseudomonas sp. ANT_H12B]
MGDLHSLVLNQARNQSSAVYRPSVLAECRALSEVIMSKLSFISLCVALSVSSTQGWAETVVPLKGQTSQQIQLDINDCHSVAASQSSSPYSPQPAFASGSASHPSIV